MRAGRALSLAAAALLGACGGAPRPETPAPRALVRTATLFVSAGQVPGRVLSLPADSRGPVAPTTEVRGPATKLAYNFFICVDGAGRVWTTNCLSLRHAAGPLVAFDGDADGDAAPRVSIQGPRTTLTGAQSGVATDGAGNVYVADLSSVRGVWPGGHVAVFAPGADGDAAPARVIGGEAPDFHSPAGIQVDGDGWLYVADSGLGFGGFPGDVQVFAPGASGDVAAARAIRGEATRLSTPEGILLDPSGHLFVANMGSDSIVVFPPGASGNVAPRRTIAGPLTRLARPCGLALDEAECLYVGTSDPDGKAEVLVFAPGADGNVAPLRTITIAAKGLHAPAGVAIGRTSGGPPGPGQAR